nr:MAG TPA: hypothetical protein [Caudoviricetes sp.]
MGKHNCPIFLPFRAVYQPRPKGQPTPPAGYLVSRY